MIVKGALVGCFESREDPRMVNKCRHKLSDILVIGVCARIANADSWGDMALVGESKGGWLRQWLELPSTYCGSSLPKARSRATAIKPL